MYSLNRATIIGNLGQDPDIRTLDSGQRIATLSVATSESWKDKTTGERQERTQWHRVTVFNDGLAGVIERNLSKGSKVFVAGQIETRKYTDKQGVERYVTEIVLRQYGGELVLLDGRDGPGRPPPPASDDRPGARPATYGDVKGRQADPARPQPAPAGGNDLNDDIPF